MHSNVSSGVTHRVWVSLNRPFPKSLHNTSSESSIMMGWSTSRVDKNRVVLLAVQHPPEYMVNLEAIREPAIIRVEFSRYIHCLYTHKIVGLVAVRNPLIISTSLQPFPHHPYSIYLFRVRFHRQGTISPDMIFPLLSSTISFTPSLYVICLCGIKSNPAPSVMFHENVSVSVRLQTSHSSA